MADGWACAPDFARNPRRRCRHDADSSCPPARHAAKPNRVHSRLGLVFCLGLLSTCPRGHAVALGYLEVARCFKTQTFTGWFHKRLSARTAATRRRFPKADLSALRGRAERGGGERRDALPRRQVTRHESSNRLEQSRAALPRIRGATGTAPACRAGRGSRRAWSSQIPGCRRGCGRGCRQRWPGGRGGIRKPVKKPDGAAG